jgi:hypothetical protein
VWPGDAIPRDELLKASPAGRRICVLTDLTTTISWMRRDRNSGVPNIAVGYDNIDVLAARRHAAATNTPDVLTEATAAHAFIPGSRGVSWKATPSGERLERLDVRFHTGTDARQAARDRQAGDGLAVAKRWRSA